jgi:hypothetical protein
VCCNVHGDGVDSVPPRGVPVRRRLHVHARARGVAHAWWRTRPISCCNRRLGCCNRRLGCCCCCLSLSSLSSTLSSTLPLPPPPLSASSTPPSATARALTAPLCPRQARGKDGGKHGGKDGGKDGGQACSHFLLPLPHNPYAKHAAPSMRLRATPASVPLCAAPALVTQHLTPSFNPLPSSRDPRLGIATPALSFRAYTLCWLQALKVPHS